jgi:hypothetical protein
MAKKKSLWKRFTKSVTKIAKDAGKGIQQGALRVGNVVTGDSEEEIKKLKKENANLKTKNDSLNNTINDPLTVDGTFKKVPLLSTPLIVDHDISQKIQYDPSSGLMNTTNAYYNMYSNYYDGYQRNDEIIENNLKPQIEYLKQTELTGIDYAFESVKTQNILLDNQIKENTEKYSIDNQKIYYQSQQMSRLKTYNFFLFVLYYIVAIILIYNLFVNSNASIAIKIIIVIFVIGYPFIIDILQQLFLFMWYYITSFIKGEVYHRANKQ